MKLTWIFPISKVKSNKPLSTMHILNITSSQLLVGSRSLPKVLQINKDKLISFGSILVFIDKELLEMAFSVILSNT